MHLSIEEIITFHHGRGNFSSNVSAEISSLFLLQLRLLKVLIIFHAWTFMLVVSLTNLIIVILFIDIVYSGVNLLCLVHVRISPSMLVEQRSAIFLFFKSFLLDTVIYRIRSMMRISTLGKSIIILSLLRT